MRQMRKANRRKDEAWALQVLDRAPYVTVGFVRPDGSPYCLPLSLVRTDERTFYFHCAGEGEKLDCIRHCPEVSLSAVTQCSPAFEEEKENYTMHYRSAVAVGKASIVECDEEKTQALRLLCERFLPRFMDHFDSAIARSLAATTVVRIDLTEPAVGKTKQG